MNMHESFFTSTVDRIVTCPNCGDDHYESNRFDEAEALCREALDELPLLLFEGRYAEARERMTAFYNLRIENDIRPEHFCLTCGAQFCG